MNWVTERRDDGRVTSWMDTRLCFLSVTLAPIGYVVSVSFTYEFHTLIRWQGRKLRHCSGFINGTAWMFGPSLVRTRKASTGRRWAERFLRRLLRENPGL